MARVTDHGRGLRRTVVLVGLMGAGKTSIGRRVAEALGAPFRDSDDEIASAAGMAIPEIFAQMGEPAFRAGERRVIARLLDLPPQVLATGGGAFMNAETRALIRERALSVWIRADLDTLVERTARRNDRPLLRAGDPREILARLMAERHPVYAEADLTVDSPAGGPHETVVVDILAALDARGALEHAP
jgi:shikimate kinase